MGRPEGAPSARPGPSRGWPGAVGDGYRRQAMADVDEPRPDDAAPGTEGHGPAADGPRDDEVVDELPEDLDAAGFVGPYVFPDNNRRRIPGYLYLGLALACVAAWLAAGQGDGVLVNHGFLGAGVLLAVLGVYQLLAGFDLVVDERDALVAAGREVGFAVGHASAQLGWRGLRSRPTWRILLYSAEEPPATRGLVLVDGVDGEIVARFVEENPEDWSDLDGRLTAGQDQT
jgi:hypothetical protein